MTGNEVRSLRQRCDLTVAQFADLVGSTAPTAYRWEARGADDARMEPFQTRLIGLLATRVLARSPTRAGAFTRGLREAVLIGGGLRGLHYLLADVFEGRRL
jgi:transcriptional regulator with XRE-family HTH domain